MAMTDACAEHTRSARRLGLMVTGAFSAPALDAAPNPHKCNAGNGNASETDPSNDCDPGNSRGNDQGGD